MANHLQGFDGSIDVFVNRWLPTSEQRNLEKEIYQLNLNPARAPTLDEIWRDLVEPDGIEPTTSCLQSRRSPS